MKHYAAIHNPSAGRGLVEPQATLLCCTDLIGGSDLGPSIQQGPHGRHVAVPGGEGQGQGPVGEGDDMGAWAEPGGQARL